MYWPLCIVYMHVDRKMGWPLYIEVNNPPPPPTVWGVDLSLSMPMLVDIKDGLVELYVSMPMMKILTKIFSSSKSFLLRKRITELFVNQGYVIIVRNKAFDSSIRFYK